MSFHLKKYESTEQQSKDYCVGKSGSDHNVAKVVNDEDNDLIHARRTTAWVQHDSDGIP